MQTRTRTAHDKRWPFWLATAVLLVAALLAHLVPAADTQSVACTSLSAVGVDAEDPVAADTDPEFLPAAHDGRMVPVQLKPALAITGGTQHFEPPPQRPPRPLA